MFQCTGPLPIYTRPVLDPVAVFATIISMMVEAQSLEAQLEINASDPALADICDEAEALWSAAASRLLHFSQSTFCPGCIADAAKHLAALALSDGSDPGQERHHLSSIVFAAADASIPAETRSQLARAVRLMTQILSVKDPFTCIPALSSISPTQEGY
jgi:hypothetical protein